MVLPNFIDGLPVYGASEPDLNIIQNFLHVIRAVLFLTPFWLRIYWRRKTVKIVKKVTSINNHRLAPYISSKNVGSYNLRWKQSPKINTVRLCLLL